MENIRDQAQDKKEYINGGSKGGRKHKSEASIQEKVGCSNRNEALCISL